MKSVYIDSQNTHKAIEKLSRKLDREKFYNYIKNKYKIDNTIMFLWYIENYKSFYEKLEKIWYKIIFKETYISENKITKWNVDIDIAICVLVDFFKNNLNEWFLVIADWDYNSLVNFMKENNILWKVIVPGMHDTSRFLTKSAWKKVQNIWNLKDILWK